MAVIVQIPCHLIKVRMEDTGGQGGNEAIVGLGQSATSITARTLSAKASIPASGWARRHMHL
jgi:hypothetical protein